MKAVLLQPIRLFFIHYVGRYYGFAILHPYMHGGMRGRGSNPPTYSIVSDITGIYKKAFALHPERASNFV